MLDTVQDFDPAAISDDWEILADAGRALAEQNDLNRWVLGDLAGRVEKRYGDDALGSYASEIRVFERTLRVYRQVSSFYPVENGIRVAFPALSWSHYRLCVRLGDLDSAEQMLADASDHNWSARDLTDAIHVALGKPPVNRPLLIETIVADAGALAVVSDTLERDVAYIVKVYRAEVR